MSYFVPALKSLSARRAWIEICQESAPSGAPTTVALRKESVDRNDVIRPAIDVFLASLSARRAWIEILSAVLTELLILLSLSARRAWIEILLVYLALIRYLIVALRKESVDRNLRRHKRRAK